MAYFFQLAVECGRKDDAIACADHFSRWEAGDSGVPVRASVEQAGEDGAWWAVVVPVNESESGVVDDDVAKSLTDAGRALLDRLLTAPPFRFAVIGVEAFEVIKYADLEAATGSDRAMLDGRHGLVVSDELLEKLGPSPAFEPFAPGYSWIPYQGETPPAAD